tara:strand:- start:767 stop:1726 length:960 start_codon:yes stop_codon:yes gene_type:complete
MILKVNQNNIINIVSGGAGFLGSHLIDRLMKKGESVICIDNFLTGDLKNISKWLNHSNFSLINHNLINSIDIKGDKIWHLASPASPSQYQLNPINTSKTIILGSLNMLELARKLKSKILLASSSEIYGNPTLHPQIESYFGNVNPNSLKSCYREGKRMAETLFTDFSRIYDIEIRIARIFNTYGPRMKINDGRVVSNFIVQGLTNKNLTIFGDGSQTRSFCYVDDLVKGLMCLMDGDLNTPVNLGNFHEIKILDLAFLISEKLNKKLDFEFTELPDDEPIKRKPSIKLANIELNWKPIISLDHGLDNTIRYYKSLLNEV